VRARATRDVYNSTARTFSQHRKQTLGHAPRAKERRIEAGPPLVKVCRGGLFTIGVSRCGVVDQHVDPSGPLRIESRAPRDRGAHTYRAGPHLSSGSEWPTLSPPVMVIEWPRLSRCPDCPPVGRPCPNAGRRVRSLDMQFYATTRLPRKIDKLYDRSKRHAYCLINVAMQIRFDRGTIVIESAISKQHAEQVPGVVWDERVQSWRAPAEAYTLIADFVGRDALSLRGKSGRPVATAPLQTPDLRWYQQEALASWAAANRRGVVALPTGAGKTILAVAAITSCAVPALCLVPTRVLLDQWVTVLRQYFGEVGRLGDGERTIGPITVATYASAVLWGPKIGDRFGLVVVDESHHVGAECPAELLEMLMAPARLGLTATPALGNVAVAVERHVGPIVYSLAIDDLVGDALSDFDLVTIPISLNHDERRRYNDARATFNAVYSSFQRSAPGAQWKHFVAAAMRSETGRCALTAWRTSRAILAYPKDKQAVLRKLLMRHVAQRTLVFTQDTSTAYSIARECLVQPITHEIGRKERSVALQRFNSGEINVLVSAQVLDEGLDVPAAEVAIVVGGSASSRRHVQRIGRVLRPAPNKRARVYELTVDNTVEVATARRRRDGIHGAM
jgi:superfamily II DNA or RNA helicase